MLETSLVALQDISLDKIFDEPERKALYAEFAKLMEQVVLLLSRRLEPDDWRMPSHCSWISRVFLICSISYCRATSTFQLEFACREWAAMSPTSKLSPGKFSAKITTPIASPSVSSAGPSCESLSHRTPKLFSDKQKPFLCVWNKKSLVRVPNSYLVWS